MAGGSKSARSTPLLGEACLISAITAARPRPARAPSAAAKPRAAGMASASRRNAGSGRARFAAASSSALAARIFFSTSGVFMRPSGCA
jgi:hypothetical protein